MIVIGKYNVCDLRLDVYNRISKKFSPIPTSTSLNDVASGIGEKKEKHRIIDITYVNGHLAIS